MSLTKPSNLTTGYRYGFKLSAIGLLSFKLIIKMMLTREFWSPETFPDERISKLGLLAMGLGMLVGNLAARPMKNELLDAQSAVLVLSKPSMQSLADVPGPKTFH